MKRIISLLISFLIYGGGPIILGILSGHPVWGIIVGLFVVSSLYLLSMRSYLSGAEYALRKPPKIGETWVEWKIGQNVVWKSNRFPFVPLPSQEGELPAPVSIETNISRYDRVNRRHKHYWRFIRSVVEKGGTYEEMRQALKAKGIKHSPTDNTLREIIKKYDTKSSLIQTDLN